MHSLLLIQGTSILNFVCIVYMYVSVFTLLFHMHI